MALAGFKLRWRPPGRARLRLVAAAMLTCRRLLFAIILFRPSGGLSGGFAELVALFALDLLIVEAPLGLQSVVCRARWRFN